MNPFVKLLVWLTLAVLLAIGILAIDVRRAVTQASRVSIQSETQAELILARFPFEPGYFGRVVDSVPETRWQILLPLLPRHSQLVAVKKLAWLNAQQKASLLASHVALLGPSGRLATGLDRASTAWLNIPIENATAQQLDQLAAHRKGGKSKAAATAANPSPRTPAPANSGAPPR